jgi:hypothetical protein
MLTGGEARRGSQKLSRDKRAFGNRNLVLHYICMEGIQLLGIKLKKF